MALLRAENISKRYDGETDVLKPLSFELPELKKLAIVGETGSGKSTLLKIISGLLQPSTGAVYFEKERIESPEEKLIPGHKDIAYLSQYFSLPKFLIVKDYLEDLYTLSEEEADVIYESCNVMDLLSSDTRELSGGEKQRVALAKLLTKSPKLLLLDEPFSNLDPLNKSIIKTVIDKVVHNLGTTCTLVAHDPLDVLSWADEIMVLQGGDVVQVATPNDIYKYPVNQYVAGIFGRFNLIDLRFVKKPDKHHQLYDNKLVVRPEQVELKQAEKSEANGQVMKVDFFGGYEEVTIQLGSIELIARSKAGEFRMGDSVKVVL